VSSDADAFDALAQVLTQTAIEMRAADEARREAHTERVLSLREALSQAATVMVERMQGGDPT
jgi:hypothetical protein